MTLRATAVTLGERLPLPDARAAAVHRARWSAGRDRRSSRDRPPTPSAAFRRDMASYPIAEHTDERQRPALRSAGGVLRLVLGPQLKYSCCLYDDRRARSPRPRNTRWQRPPPTPSCADGQTHPGAGLRLGLAVAVDGRALSATRGSPRSPTRTRSAPSSRRSGAARGLANLDGRHRRHERLRADRPLRPRRLGRDVRAHGQLARPAGARARLARSRTAGCSSTSSRHAATPYRFDHRRPGRLDRPALLHRRHHAEPRPDPAVSATFRRRGGLALERRALRSGPRDDWLANFDRNADAIRAILREVYGDDARLWQRRWRLFFLATAGLFGQRDGDEWGVSHYRLKPRV